MVETVDVRVDVRVDVHVHTLRRKFSGFWGGACGILHSATRARLMR